MRKKHTYQWSWLMVILLSFTFSCTERIDIELDSTYRRLVVYGTLTNDSIRHQIILSSTSDYFSNQPSPSISDALVELSFNGQTLLLQENDTVPGSYECPEAFRGVPGTTYRLDISQVDVDMDGEIENYHAESTMPQGSTLEAIQLDYYSFPQISGYAVSILGSHPRDQKDWFSFMFIKNGDLLTDTLMKYTVLADDLFDDGWFVGLPVGFLNDDDPRQAVHPGDTVTLEMNSIEQVFYDFITEAQMEMMGNIPLFSGPPANVPTNISDGGMGIFAAYAVERASAVADGK
jgi:hypothetical protein